MKEMKILPHLDQQGRHMFVVLSYEIMLVLTTIIKLEYVKPSVDLR